MNRNQAPHRDAKTKASKPFENGRAYSSSRIGRLAKANSFNEVSELIERSLLSSATVSLASAKHIHQTTTVPMRAYRILRDVKAARSALVTFSM